MDLFVIEMPCEAGQGGTPPRRPLPGAAAVHLRRAVPASGVKPAEPDTGFRPEDTFNSRTLREHAMTNSPEESGIRPLRWFMHVDMDAFFASIEQLDNPELRGKPLIVGQGRRGVVSTCSYEARRFGVHSAMPVGEAKRLCPHGVFVPGRHERYREVSRVVEGVLHDFSPLVEMASIDEAYLDATGLERLFGPVEEMGMALKRAVRGATGGLTCSVGIAPVKFLAKICSDLDKPDGLYLLRHEDMPRFLEKLELSRIPGVGKKFLAALAALGIRSVPDVLARPEPFWERRFGKAGMALLRRAQGVDGREVVPYTPPKSESAETTFERDTRDRDFLKTWLLRHAERVGARMRRHGFAGRTVTLKIKYAGFRTVTRQMRLAARTSSTESLYEAGCALLDALSLEEPVRLIGLGLSGFDDEKPIQLSLMDAMPGGESAAETERRRASLDGALDELRRRYGGAAVRRGRLFARDEAERARTESGVPDVPVRDRED